MQVATATGFADLLGEALKKASASGVPLISGASSMDPRDFDGAGEEAISGSLEAFEADPSSSEIPAGRVAKAGFRTSSTACRKYGRCAASGLCPSWWQLLPPPWPAASSGVCLACRWRAYRGWCGP